MNGVGIVFLVIGIVTLIIGVAAYNWKKEINNKK